MKYLFIMAAICYVIYIITNELDRIGSKLGENLKLPDPIIASTFQAMATSGPEILIAIMAATPFISQNVWNTLTIPERACSGTLNMAFSAMDNLLGIGAIAIVIMIITKKVKSNDKLIITTNTIISLSTYIIISSLFVLFVKDGVLTNKESWVLMIIGITFVILEIVRAIIIGTNNNPMTERKNRICKKKKNIERIKEVVWYGLQYAFLIFALVVFVKEIITATFGLAVISMFSIGGILLMLTSYISSLPELLLSIKYAIEGRKEALLGMLFGSNIIDLAFAGFRSIWLNKKMVICTTGEYPQLLFIYLFFLPIVSILILLLLYTKSLKFKHFYYLFLLYLTYTISGFFLL